MLSGYLKSLKNNVIETLLLLLAISVFLPVVVSNVLVVVLLFYIIKERNFTNINYHLVMPIFLFAISGLSYYWSIDSNATLQAIPRNIFLLLVPLFFLSRSKDAIIKNDFILKHYSYFSVFVAVVFLIRASIRFLWSGNRSYFFFHGDYTNDFGLVPKELNAIHVSIFIAVAFFYFLSKKEKTKIETFALFVLMLFLLLLSSTNIICATLLISVIYFFFYSKQANRMRLRNILLLFAFLVGLFLYNKTKSYIEKEIKTSTEKGIGHNVINNVPNESHRITIYEAWNNQKFTPNDFFPGTAFRVYQARLFFEFLKEDNIFWKGFGLNAFYSKIEEKGIANNVFLGNETHEGYQTKNFHNQYIQTFAELGVFGFLILLAMLILSLKKAIQYKDFVHLAFTILMISLFLTESFLSRQRGIVFFVLFYCVFMLVEKEKTQKIV